MTVDSPSRRDLAAVALISSTLLLTELALTRIFSVVMYYHFAFLAISIALFGLSAAGVLAYLLRARLLDRSGAARLPELALLYAGATIVAVLFLVRLRVGLNYSPRNLELMLAIYLLAALPFLTGGFVLTLAIARFAHRINAVYSADLTGAACGCLVLVPLLNRFGAPGVIVTAAALAIVAALLFAEAPRRQRIAAVGVAMLAVTVAARALGLAIDVTDTKGHHGDRILFEKWNSFSRVAVYERAHGDWSLSTAYRGPLPDTRFMDIDSAASTPILRASPDLSNLQYLRYELTALVYHLEDARFTALVIGPGGGRDLASALVFGARRVDGVEINPIIADDVMRGMFLDYSGGLYNDARVRIFVDEGRSYLRRTAERYDVIQASLVDTWAATAAGAYTLTENTLYTVEAFNDYLDHLTDEGVLTITRWTFDGLRLVSLAQEACAARGWDVRSRIAIVRHDKVATFLMKRSPFTDSEIARLAEAADRLRFEVLYAPALPDPENDYARLVNAPDRQRFYAAYPQDIRPTTDDRPFFFHTTKLGDQFQVAFGRSMLFGNGLSSLMTLLAISIALVVLFVVGPLVVASGDLPRGWFGWLLYFGALGAGFMMLEVAVLQRFVLLVGHPVYSLTVTLFALLVGTGAGARWSRRFELRSTRRLAVIAIAAAACVAVLFTPVSTPVLTWAMPFTRAARIMVAAALIVPVGFVLGIPLPSGIRLLADRSPSLITWAWGLNGALSVVGATLAVFIAMNWGFSATLLTSAATYVVGLAAFLSVASLP